jgi:hypothetical protein
MTSVATRLHLNYAAHEARGLAAVAGLNNNANNNPRIDGWAGV